MVLACLAIAAQAVENNVYGEPLASCGSSKECTYHASDSGAHEICVTKLPNGFSAATGQGHWSDADAGKPWCICIWAYSNYILQKKDLPVDCKAIPSKVLEERYSLDKFAQCGQMSSTNGCGPEDIRRSIHKICNQCSSTAPSSAAKSALEDKCKAIENAASSAPPAPPTASDAVVPELD